MIRFLSTAFILLILLVNLGCSDAKIKNFSFLELIDTELVVGKQCRVELSLEVQAEPPPPQLCYARISNIDILELELEGILNKSEVAQISDTKIYTDQEQIPNQVLSNYFNFVDAAKFNKKRKELDGEELFYYYGTNTYTKLSNPIYINENLVIIFVNTYDVTGFNSGGQLLVFRTKQNTWKLVYEFITWMS